MGSISVKDMFNAAAPIVGERGHYNTLNAEVFKIQGLYNEIRSVFSPDYNRETKDDEYQDLVGHYGLGGEFANGVGSALNNYLCTLAPVIKKPSSEFLTKNSKAIRMAMEHVAATFYQRPSQKSKYYTNDENAKHEASGAAMQRALLNLHQWIASRRNDASELAPAKRKDVIEKLETMLASVEKCEKAFSYVENFAQVTSMLATQNNKSVVRIETREAVKFVNGTIRALNPL